MLNDYGRLSKKALQKLICVSCLCVSLLLCYVYMFSSKNVHTDYYNNMVGKELISFISESYFTNERERERKEASKNKMYPFKGDVSCAIANLPN